MSICPFYGLEQAKAWKRSPTAFAYCASCRVAFRCREELPETTDYHAAIAEKPDWDAETPAAVLNAYAGFLKRRLRPDGAVLDFGTGTGGFVQALRAQGIDAYGLEPSATARRAATREGMHVATSLTDLPAVRWAGVTAIEVAEHIADPTWLRQLYYLLAPGAFIFITTPNRDSVAARLAGPGWSQMTNPFHIVLFNARALRTVIEQAGFTNVRLLLAGPVLGRTAAHRAAHTVLLAAGRHSSLRMVGFKPVSDAPCG
jgi:2-polyprenyl-3-methyl-5-hydroxy-6-metoxy-1,4-benzoquinol methylase